MLYFLIFLVDHEGFYAELEQNSSGDGFSTIAEYYGKSAIFI